MNKKLIMLFLTLMFVISMSVVALADVKFTDFRDGSELVLPDLPSDVGKYYVILQNAYDKCYVIYIYDEPKVMDEIVYQKKSYFLKDGEWHTSGNGTYGFDRLCYSSFDIIKSDGSVFFQAPKMGALKKVLQMTSLGGVLSQVILLIPLVILVVVSYLGLRKCLNFVLTVLKRA